MTVLIDSWAWIEYFKGSPAGEKAKEFIESGQEILVSAINVSEIQGWLLRNSSQTTSKQLLQFLLDISFVVPVTTPIALRAAQLKWELQLGLADAIVLATAQEHSSSIVTGDDDFKDKENVTYIGN